MSSILLIGKNSYLARNFISACGIANDVRAVSHGAIESERLEGIACVINFACHPDYATAPYRPEIDVDRRIVDRLAGRGIHFVMLSSRKVYEPDLPCPVREDAPLDSGDDYGRNKAITEAYVRETLGDTCTILRLANIIGFELERRTFIGRALQTLIEHGRIVLDISPFTRRDFVPVAHFARMLEKVLMIRPSGTFNLGSGLPTRVGRAALWVIEGYGRGDLVVISPEEKDQFVLDVGRLEGLFGPVCSPRDIKNKCIEIGRRLNDA